MPHIATWWCGQKAAREEVLARLDEFAIEGAYGSGVPGFPGVGPVLASELSAVDRERLRSAIRDRGIDYVGQELVRLSTTPVWDNGRIMPRPFVLRVFATASRNGWTIMPGGFCRIAEQPDARAVRWATARARRMSGWSRTRRFRRRRCCRRWTRCGSGVSPAGFRAGPPTICSGSAAISSAPRRRCGWCGRSGWRSAIPARAPPRRCTRWSASSGY